MTAEKFIYSALPQVCCAVWSSSVAHVSLQLSGHYVTGHPIPADDIERLRGAKNCFEVKRSPERKRHQLHAAGFHVVALDRAGECSWLA